MEELLSIQKYAAQTRQSVHNVIKKTMNGELKTVVKEENGKEITYILSSPVDNITTVTAEESEENEINYKKEYEALHKKYLILKTKYEKLLEKH
jgi:hypothetical protein